MVLFGDDGRQSLTEDLRLFAVMTGVAELFGLLSVILMCAWLSNYYGGFSLLDSQTKFNLHPLLMTFAFVFLFGNAIIIYRVFRRLSKFRIKIAHACIQLVVFFLAVIAIKIAWDGHNEDSEGEIAEKNDQAASSTSESRPKRHAGMHDEEGSSVHLATLHTWFGLATVILFAAQWLSGLVTFLWPQLRVPIRQAYMPLHVFWGTAIFVLGALSALTGLVMMSTRFAESHKLSGLPSEGWLINSLGLCIVAYVISVLFILVQPSYKRRALPEEDDKVPLTGLPNTD